MNLSYLQKENSIAPEGFNRWLLPPAALAIHLCIGMAYGFSVFWLPLSKALNGVSSIECSADRTFLNSIFTTSCDWKISMLGWTYTLFFVFLGSSAAVFGQWLEHAGPRKAGVISAICWCGGLCISALGIYTHQLWLLWLGSGVIGGIGLGLGYISPVSTLIKWFPDHRGMATGMAIMGFGGGAVVGAPLANYLMKYYATSTSPGVWQTFLTLAIIYFIFMIIGALNYYLPHPNHSSNNKTITTKNSSTSKHVHVQNAWKTPQFWLLWFVLCLNVTAGIGIIGMASPMLQEIFAGKLIGINVGFNELTNQQKIEISSIAAGFIGLLSLFNIGGRIIWSSLSDVIGRKATYGVFFFLGCILYIFAPTTAHYGIGSFVIVCCIIISMYGGGFATIPAYLADIFGTQMVGAIHGRILTAWSAAGIFGPVTVNYLREYQLAIGASNDVAYNTTIYVLAGLLAIGFICNLFITPVNPKYHMTDIELMDEQAKLNICFDNGNNDKIATNNHSSASNATAKLPASLILVSAWSAVCIPLCIGIWVTLQKTWILFH